MLRMVRDGEVEAVDGSVVALQAESVCLHGDSPGAVAMARAVAAALRDAGVTAAGVRAEAAALRRPRRPGRARLHRGGRGLGRGPGRGPAGRGRQVVPAARSVLVVRADGADLPAVRPRARRRRARAAGAEEGDVETVQVEVLYDGEDLDDVAAHTGLSRAEVVAAHTGQTWRVAFGGFAPGFGYLIGDDERLHVPRREESRTSVPRGRGRPGR